MRLIKKECPNCGANLSFDENDKNCKCEYCRSSFLIEKDSNDIENFNLKAKKGITITIIIIIIVVTSIIGITFFSIFKGLGTVFNKSNTYISKVNEISNSDYNFLDSESLMTIDSTSYSGDYSIQGKPKRLKIYLMVNNDGNKLIPIYNVSYKNFFSKDIQTVYIPVIYENIKDSFDFNNGKIEAPKYYLNNEKTDFVYGYNDLNVLYDEVVKPLKKNYKIKEK